MSNSANHSSRRDFLKGKSAVDAVSELGRNLAATPATPLTPSSAEPPTRSYLVKVERRAMACQFEVFLNAGEHAASTEHALDALDLIDQLEEQLSVYRQRSEVTLLNHAAARKPIRVEPRLFELLHDAIQLHEATGQAFDITAGPFIKAWARLRREGIAPTDEHLAALRAAVSSSLIQLDPVTSTVSFLHPEVTIDLGGIGKGYALDRAAELLERAEVKDFMIHGGTSSVLARGQRMSGTDRPGWTIGVQHPLRADRRFAEIQLCDRALGTSGAGTQQFYYRGQKLGHIIDPRTGLPASGVLSVTVVAPTAAHADALSTAFYVLGVDAARNYVVHHPDIMAIITTPSRQSGGMEIHELNCEQLIWQRLDANADSVP